MRQENDSAASMRWRMTAVRWKPGLNQGQRRCRSFNEVCAQGDQRWLLRLGVEFAVPCDKHVPLEVDMTPHRQDVAFAIPPPAGRPCERIETVYAAVVLPSELHVREKYVVDAAFKRRALCACPQRATPKRDVPIVQSGKNFQVPESKNGETRSEIAEILDGAAALSILRGGDRNDGDVGSTRLVGARKRADVRRFGAAFVNREQAVGVEGKCLQEIPVSMRGPSPLPHNIRHKRNVSSLLAPSARSSRLRICLVTERPIRRTRR